MRAMIICSIFESIVQRQKPKLMKHLTLLCGIFMISLHLSAQGPAKNVYFTVDSFHLNDENVLLLEKSFSSMQEGDKLTFRVLVRDDVKNKTSINELDWKRSIELSDFFVAEGIPAANIKMIKTLGREAKGFISDEMKNLNIYDVEVYKAQGSVMFSTSGDIGLNAQPAESFSVSPDSDKEIIGSKGVSVTFPAGVFEYKTGLPVHEEIRIELKEYLNTGEMAGAGLITMNGQTPVQASGIIWLKASVAGKELRLRKGKQIQLKFPPTALSETQIYLGQEIGGVLNLIPAEPKANAALSASRLHWIAAAAPDKEAGSATLSIKTGVSYDVAVRLILKDKNEVIAAVSTPGSKEAEFGHIFPGRKATLVAYGQKDGKVYLYSKELTTSVDGKEKLQLKECSVSELSAFLNGLGK
jgi:hypothetical protein